MTIQEISDLLDSKLDLKLEPIKNGIEAIKIDIHAMRTHVDSINTRLQKLEERQYKMDNKLDSLGRNTRGQEATA